jgi:hypothetical protein
MSESEAEDIVLSSQAWHDEAFDELSEPPGTEVSSTTTTHSRQLFERIFDFRLSAEGQDTRRRYTVDTYFFIPRSVGISRDNFTRHHFYNSLSSYLRIQSETGLRRSALQTGQWNLPRTEACFRARFRSLKRQSLIQGAIQEVKLFACLMEHQLKLLRLQVVKNLQRRSGRQESRMRYVQKKLAILLELLATFRRMYVQPVRTREIWVEDELQQAFLLSDEFISYRLESLLISLIELLDTARDTEPATGLRAFISVTLAAEIERRDQSDQIRIQGHSGQDIPENYYYRLGLLKKFVSEVLYLDIHNLQKDKTYRNLVAALGAALAATWAGLIDLQRFYWMQQIGQEGALPSSDFALRFFLIVVVGIVAYIFKDRIKELTREYFYERLKQYLPDYEYQLRYRFAGEAPGQQVGKARQFMRYLNKSALPADIGYIRESAHPSKLEPERNEEVIHFSKQMTFETGLMRRHFSHIRYIRDISRFSIDEFLLRIDEPSKKLRYFDPHKGIAAMKAPKVYHLNLIARYAVSEFHEGKWLPARVEFEHLRLVLNKKGILRVEQVLPKGELSYQEEIP